MEKTKEEQGDSLPVPNEGQVKKQKHLQVVLRHVKLVQDTAQLLAERLFESGSDELARVLIANSFCHDNSKFFGIEWEYLLSNGEAKKESLELAIHQHQATNQHHPEFWGGIEQMPRVCVAEMVCDWFARSTEFGTDLRIWVKEAALKKYGITSRHKVYQWIKEFLDMILEKPFSS